MNLPEPEKGYKKHWDIVSSLFYDENFNWPKISIITPSYNQGRFIERTIRSILLQKYPNLEYIIIDGKSTDLTIKIIKKYNKHIHYWVSEKDKGMYEAINKGFKISTGEILAWSPTGDFYEPNSFFKIAKTFIENSEVKWLTSLFKIKCDEKGNIIDKYKIKGFNKKSFFYGFHFNNGPFYSKYMIQQQSTFWHRTLWLKSGSRMDDSMKGAGDFDLWARFFNLGFKLYSIDSPIGVFMTHNEQESIKNIDVMKRDQHLSFKKNGGRIMNRLEFNIKKIARKFKFFDEIFNLKFKFYHICWIEEDNTSKIKLKCCNLY